MGLLVAGRLADVNKLNLEPDDYTPVLSAATTAPVLGSGGTISGHYYRIGNLVQGHVAFRFGTSGASFGSGIYMLSLPVLPDMDWHFAASRGVASMIASGILRDNSSVGSSLPANGWLFDADPAPGFMQIGSLVGSAVTPTSPWTWAVSDGAEFMFSYLTAEDG